MLTHCMTVHAPDMQLHTLTISVVPLHFMIHNVPVMQLHTLTISVMRVRYMIHNVPDIKKHNVKQMHYMISRVEDMTLHI